MVASSPPIGSDAEALWQRLAELNAERDSLRARLSGLGAGEFSAHRAAESPAPGAEIAAACTDMVQARQDATGASAGHARAMQASQAKLATSEAANTTLRDANADLEVSRAALHQSEAWLQTVLDSATEYAFIVADLSGIITGWTSGADQVLGWGEAEAVGQNIELFFTPQDRAAGVPAEEMRLALEQGRAVDERWHLRRSGELFWAIGTMMPLRRDPGSEVVGYLKILRDRTQQHEAQQALRRSEAALAEGEAQLRGIVESSADCIKLLDLEGKLLSMNGPGQCALEIDDFGAFRNRQWALFWPDAAHSDMEQALTTAWGGGVGRFAAFRPTDRGKPKWWDVVVSPILSTDGRPARLVAILRDVTGARRAEEALRESEAQLRQAQKLEAIGRLAAGVAHDFNNILQGVVGGLELVLDEVEVGTSTHDFAAIALGSAKRGSYLTHHLLSYARKQMLQPKVIELAPFLSDMRTLLARTLGPHIAVEIRANGATPSVQVDPGQLATALLNLAINASHAMSRGGTLILEVREENQVEEQRGVVITMTDTGVGMDEATLAQAFEPFFTTKGLEGTGLGLSMVQGFAEQSGGSSRIASAPGQGTTVELRLPAASADSHREQPDAPAKLQGSGRVLLVDDVSDVLVTAGAFLKKAGFQVVQAGSSDQALTALTTGERFDAVVSDYAMPGLSGVDLIERVRAVQPGLPAVIITGFAEMGDGETLPEETVVLRKPFQRRQLIEALLCAMGRNPAGQDPGSGRSRILSGTKLDGE